MKDTPLNKLIDYLHSCIEIALNSILNKDDPMVIDTILNGLANVLCNCAFAARISKEELIKNVGFIWEQRFGKPAILN